MTIDESAFWIAGVVFVTLAVGGCSRDRFVSLGHRDTAPPAMGMAGGSAREPKPDAGAPAAPGASTPRATPERMSIDQSGADNPAGLSEDDAKKLKAGGPPANLRWLYPYDETVFPRETLAPTLMWEGDASTAAVYLHIHSKYFDYKTILEPTLERAILSIADAPPRPRVQLDPRIWDQAGEQTQGSSDPLTLELSTLVNGVVAGPVSTRLIIAEGSIKGSIYYSSTAPNTLGTGAGWGSLYRIPPHGSAQRVDAVAADEPAGSCTGCHAVSANGARMILQTMSIGATPGTEEFAKAYSYPLTPTGSVGKKAELNRYAAFAALYPDGTKYLTGSLVQDGLFAAGPFGTSYGNIATLDKSIPVDATLYDSDTGEVVPDTGISAGALMPMFSPDGRQLVFNDFALDRAHGLAAMDYDPASHKATNYRVLMREGPQAAPSLGKAGIRPGWPFFLPDNQAVVFVRTDSASFAGGAAVAGAAFGGATTAAPSSALDPFRDLAKPPSSDLHIVDARSGTVTLLARAMGFRDRAAADRGETYLPFGDADLHHNYNTTVSPVAAGGYFWVFFDSLRNYGNLGLRHQLWGAAIDIRPDGSYVTDPSHPPFYLAGQTLVANNYRAFAARDACLPEGPCTSGIDCCSGYCSDVCVPPQRGQCSRTDERCDTSADCCETASDACINGFCAFVPLQ